MDDCVDGALHANRANWDARAKVHAHSPFYDLQRYSRDPLAISSVVAWDRKALGSVSDLTLLHLQCHIGTDSVSWARLGAKVTGLDFSPSSLKVARGLAQCACADVQFVLADAQYADHALKQAFDIVYTSVGVLCWIPDIKAWARSAVACVRPGGRLYLRDGHPILATMAQASNGADIILNGDYFGHHGPMRSEERRTYSGDLTEISAPLNYQWQHTLSDILTALCEQGLRIDKVNEFDWLDWQQFPAMVRGSDGRWRFPAGIPALPLSFSVLASRDDKYREVSRRE